MPRITLDAAQWFRGASTSDDLIDGGFSPDDKGVSLFVSPGLLKPGPIATETASAFSANGIIAYTHPKDTSSTFGWGLTANASDDGTVKAFSVSGPGSYTTAYGPDTGRDYLSWVSDITNYKSGIYYTSTTDVALAGDFDWWTATLSLTALGTGVVHRLVQFGDILYITDGRYIHSWDGTTGTYNALDLPSGYSITDMCVFQNMLFISAEIYTSNDSGSYYGRTKIFTWDGYSPTWIDETDITEHINFFLPVGGILYAFTNNTFSYFNGSTLVHLRNILKIDKNKATVYRGEIIFVQDDAVVRYGNPVAGRQRFFSYPWKHEGGNITSIFAFFGSTVLASRGSNAMQFSFDTVSDAGSYVRYFKENRIPLGDYAYIRRFTIELDTAVASGSTIEIYYLNSNGDTVTVGSINNTDHNGRREIVFDVENDLATYTVQPRYKWTDGSLGIRRVHIDYEFSEDRPTK